MSFINLMASDVWSEADITNQVQNLIRVKFSAEDELKAARLARKPDATTAERSYVSDLDAWIAQCVQLGREARADMALLQQVLQVESAKMSLSDLPADGDPAPLQAVIDTATVEVLGIVAMRAEAPR